MEQVLDAFEAARRRHPGLREGHLVLEHGCFADAPTTRKRAVRLGLGVCVQHPQLYCLAGSMVSCWGEERTGQVLPIKSWVADGALVSAGSDHNITFLNPLRGIWGMVTRRTASAGVRGVDEAIERAIAFELSTVVGGALVGDPRLGPLAPGRHADLVGFRVDPLACPIDDLPELEASVTLMGGRAVHDPEHRFGYCVS